MRGNYFEDRATIERKVRKAVNPATVTPTGPYHVTGISTPSRETIASLVAFAAHTALKRAIESGFEGYPSLAGLTREQVDAAIREALA